MKKSLTFLLFSMLVYAPCMAGNGGDGGDEGDDGDGNTEVPMSQSTTGNGHNRGQEESPEVYYNQTTGVMTVTFLADEAYLLTVTDSFGLPVYTSSLTTSGIPTAYVLNLASPGMYLVTISSPGNTFTSPLALE